MKIFKPIYWFWTFLKDKTVEVLFFFTKSNELDSYEKQKEYSENFLNDFDHQERTKKILLPLLNEQLQIDEDEIDKMYRLNFTYFSEWSLNRIEYYITNHFWSLLGLFEIDTFHWSDEEVFGTPSLITYLVLKKDKICFMVLVSLHKQKYTLLKTHKIKKFSLRQFKRKQLIFSAEKGFLTI